MSTLAAGSLRITLEQFGTYRLLTTFTFEGPGVDLLQGKSGLGKTTIMDAIQYCLFGKPKRPSWGERSCRVTLEFDAWTIVRIGNKADKTMAKSDEAKTPASKGAKIPARNSLVLRAGPTEFKEAEAQALINERFGTNFTVTSYITQKDVASFFSLGQAERIKFLEQVAFGDVDIGDLKKRVKTKIAERREALAQKGGEFNFTRDEASKHPEPAVLPCPLDKPWTEIRAKNERTKQRKNDKALKAAMTELTELTRRQAEALRHRERRQNFEAEMADRRAELESIRAQLTVLPIVDTSALEGRLAFLRGNKELNKLTAQHTDEEARYKADIVSEQYQLQADLDERLKRPVVDDRTVELKTQVKLKEQTRRLAKRLTQIVDALAELDTPENYTTAITELREREAELLSQILAVQEAETVRACPKCSASLRLVDGSLVAYDGKPHSGKGVRALKKEVDEARSDRADYEENLHEVKRLTQERELLDTERGSLGAVDMTLDYETLLTEHSDVLREQRTNQDRIAELRHKLTHHVYDGRTQARGRLVEELATKIRRARAALHTNEVGTELPNRNDPDALARELESANMKAQRRSLLQEQESSAVTRMAVLASKSAEVPCDDVDYAVLVEAKNNEIRTLRTEDKVLRDRVTRLGQYETYLEAKGTWEKWSKRLRVAQEDEAAAQRSLAVADRFMRKILETEGAAVLNTIDNINAHLAYYTEHFFLDPMSVEITPFKETKDGEKLNINIRVFYKGCACKVDELSGGEQARLELAICLAINALGSGSLLLLDESFSSLDSETTDEIVDLLKAHARESGKLILVIAHQVSEGSFDHVVTL